MIRSKFLDHTEKMKIYTKGGDQGETGLYGGSRVAKDDFRIRTYGSLDELNAWIGVALSEGEISGVEKEDLRRIQGELFQLGAELATPRGRTVASSLIEPSHILTLEARIDVMESSLPPLKNFILPGGAKSSAWLHVARTVARRAERALVSLNRAEPVRPPVLQYVNRLSDYFFVLARYLNHLANVVDVPWINS